MTKQEEIDWGLRRLITKWTNEDGTVYLYDFSKAIRAYLHENGVVIKVDTAEPPIFFSKEITIDTGQLAQIVEKVRITYKKAGIVAVEPLTKGYCAECGKYKPDDERVQNNLKCSECAYGGK